MNKQETRKSHIQENAVKISLIMIFLIAFNALTIFSQEESIPSQNSSITVFVVDDENYLIENAKVIINCTSGIKQEFFSDEFGYLLIENIPAGICSIDAISEKRFGRVSIELSETANYQAIIQIKKEQNNLLVFYAAAAALIIIIAVAGLALFYSNKKKEQKSVLLEALTENERKTMEFLLKEKEFVPQNRIRHNTGIPKATLSRAIQALESKNLIESKEFGALKKFKAKKI